MFEKPQYLTPGGYKRKSENPNKKKILKKNPLEKNSASQKNILSAKHFQKNAQRGISKEAAKLIAQAIKGMLHE